MDIISEPSISEIIILLLSCMSKYLFSKKNLSHRLIYCPENSVAPFLVSSSCLKSSQLLVRLLFLCGQLFYLYSWWKDVLIILVIQTFCSAAAAKSRQLCPTLCDPIDGSQAPTPGILQARILEWAAISFSKQFVLVGVYLFVSFYSRPL